MLIFRTIRRGNKRILRLLSVIFPVIAATSVHAQQLYVTSGTLSTAIVALNPTTGFSPTIAIANGITDGNIAVGPDGSIYQSDITNSLIWKYNANGTRQSFAATGGTDWGITVGPDGTLYYGNYLTGSVYKVDTAGNTTLLAHLFDGGGTQPSRLTLLHMGTDGNLYTTQYSGFTPNSNVVWKVDMAGNVTQVASGFGMGFQATAQNHAGDLFVTAWLSNEVYKINKSGFVSEFLNIDRPVDMVFDNTDNMFLTANGAVYEILAGTNSPVAVFTGFSDPQSLAFSQAAQTPESGTYGLLFSTCVAGCFSAVKRWKLRHTKING